MRAYSSHTFVLPLRDGHRFPMAKYAALADAAEAMPDVQVCVPPAVSIRALCRAHTEGYVLRVHDGQLSRQEQRRIGFPWSTGMVERSRRSVGATLAAAWAALEDGVSANLAGGTHHAFADRGEGYCVFNDAVVTIRELRARGVIDRALVVDCDVHQGNGTASLCRGAALTRTVSLHGARNYPFRKVDSDIDVALPDGTGDAAYLAALDEALDRAFDRFAPQLVVYLAGADPWRGDKLGRLGLTRAGLAERDRRVLRRARDAGAAVAVTMAGGYAPLVEDIVAIHAETLRVAAALASPRSSAGEGTKLNA
jgi:acetoin utilization deacetylase AcuC-like enzyme